MSDILYELSVAVPPEKVYAAVVEADRIQAWWATEAFMLPPMGKMIEVRFQGENQGHRFELVSRKSDLKVEWIIVDSLQEWLGTRMTWDLTPTPKGTKVLFGHRDWTSADGLLAYCTYHWGIYLDSLKKYLETGKGNPFPFTA